MRAIIDTNAFYKYSVTNILFCADPLHPMEGTFVFFMQGNLYSFIACNEQFNRCEFLYLDLHNSQLGVADSLTTMQIRIDTAPEKCSQKSIDSVAMD